MKLPVELEREQIDKGFTTMGISVQNIPRVSSTNSSIFPSWLDELCPGKGNG
jgi:hypothetical protein